MNHHCGRYEAFTNRRDFLKKAGVGCGLLALADLLKTDGLLAADIDRALALLHNFWYARAFESFSQVAKREPECAMAYWGAAMTYNHPFWDPPSQSDETAAWAVVQRGLSAQKATDRERLYLTAVAALYKDAGGGANPRLGVVGQSPATSAEKLSWLAALAMLPAVDGSLRSPSCGRQQDGVAS